MPVFDSTLAHSKGEFFTHLVGEVLKISTGASRTYLLPKLSSPYYIPFPMPLRDIMLVYVMCIIETEVETIQC